MRCEKGSGSKFRTIKILDHSTSASRPFLKANVQSFPKQNHRDEKSREQICQSERAHDFDSFSLLESRSLSVELRNTLLGNCFDKSGVLLSMPLKDCGNAVSIVH